MTGKELATAVALDFDLETSDAEPIVKNVLWQIGHALQSEGTVKIIDFGTFYIKERAKKKVLNPRTGEEMIIPAHNIVLFRAGKNLKEAVQ